MAKRYPKKLDQRRLLKLFARGVYSVDLDTGVVSSRKSGRPLMGYRGNDSNHHYLKLRAEGEYQVAVAVHRVVWMVGNNSTIPRGWEVHHRNKDTRDNRFKNLFCLSPIDHKKLHDGDLVEEVPF